MLLSNAIATGRVLPFKVNPNNFCGCAIGMGLAALKGEQLVEPHLLINIGNLGALSLAYKEWPWLRDRIEMKDIPKIAWGARVAATNESYSLIYGDSDTYIHVISAIFYNVVAGKATLDQLIDWVRLVEKPEIKPEAKVVEESVVESVESVLGLLVQV